ncbi:hypothetical protein V6N13_088510 [Hibiscus sabdariffa]
MGPFLQKSFESRGPVIESHAKTLSDLCLNCDSRVRSGNHKLVSSGQNCKWRPRCPVRHLRCPNLLCLVTTGTCPLLLCPWLLPTPGPKLTMEPNNVKNIASLGLAGRYGNGRGLLVQNKSLGHQKFCSASKSKSKSKSKRGRLAAGKRLYKSSIQRAKTSVGMKMRERRMGEMMEEKRRMEESLRASRRDAAEAEERLRLVETTRDRLLLESNGITILFMLLGALEDLLKISA